MRSVKAKPIIADASLKVLILKLASDKEARVEVPVGSKVTFGPAIPGPAAKNGWGDRVSEYAVRVYDGATEKAGLLAVFTGVREFRVDTIKVSKLVIRESGEELWTSDENGLEVKKRVRRDRHMIPDTFDVKE